MASNVDVSRVRLPEVREAADTHPSGVRRGAQLVPETSGVTPLQVAQFNDQRSAMALEELHILVAELRLDVQCFQESCSCRGSMPHLANGSRNVASDHAPWAVVVVINTLLRVIRSSRYCTRDVSCIEITAESGCWVIVSIYCSPLEEVVVNKAVQWNLWILRTGLKKLETSAWFSAGSVFFCPYLLQKKSTLVKAQGTTGSAEESDDLTNVRRDTAKCRKKDRQRQGKSTGPKVTKEVRVLLNRENSSPEKVSEKRIRKQEQQAKTDTQYVGNTMIATLANMDLEDLFPSGVRGDLTDDDLQSEAGPSVSPTISVRSSRRECRRPGASRQQHK